MKYVFRCLSNLKESSGNPKPRWWSATTTTLQIMTPTWHSIALSENSSPLPPKKHSSPPLAINVMENFSQAYITDVELLRANILVHVIGDVCEYGWIGKHGWNTRPLWAPSNVIWATKQLLPKTVFLRWTDFTSSSNIKLHMIIMFDDVFYGFCSCFIMWQRMMMIIIIIHSSDIN